MYLKQWYPVLPQEESDCLVQRLSVCEFSRSGNWADVCDFHCDDSGWFQATKFSLFSVRQIELPIYLIPRNIVINQLPPKIHAGPSIQIAGTSLLPLSLGLSAATWPLLFWDSISLSDDIPYSHSSRMERQQPQNFSRIQVLSLLI